MSELTKDYDIYNENGSVNLPKLKKLTGVDVPRALAEINTFAPKYAGQLTIYQRKPLVDKLKLVNPDFKVKGKSDYVVAQAIVDAVATNPAKCRACHISSEMYKMCKIIAERKLTVCHTIAMVQDEEGNDVVISLDDFLNPIHVFGSEKDAVELDVVDEPENKESDIVDEKENKTMKNTNAKKTVATKKAVVKKGDNIYIQLQDCVVFATVVKVSGNKVTVEYDGEQHSFMMDAIERNMGMQAELEDKWIDQEEEADAEDEEIEDDDSDEEEEDLDDDDEDESDESDIEETLAELSDEEFAEVWFECMGRKAKVTSKNRATLATRLIDACDEDTIMEAVDGLESNENEEDDEPEWDEILEGVSANNLKAICKKLKVPMAEIKGRTKADLVSIILEYDSDDIEKAYTAVGATSNDSNKEKEEKSSASNGKYWENETPIESTTEGNIVNYYEEARKLQVYRRIEKDGEFIKSKGVTIDVETMSGKDALQMLSMMCYALKDAVDDERVKELVNQMESINIEYNTEQYLFSETSELDMYDTDTLKSMAKNCGCDAKRIKSANKNQLMKLIIDATQKLNG